MSIEPSSFIHFARIPCRRCSHCGRPEPAGALHIALTHTPDLAMAFAVAVGVRGHGRKEETEVGG